MSSYLLFEYVFDYFNSLTFQHTPTSSTVSQRHLTFQERKAKLIEDARRKYKEKHNMLWFWFSFVFLPHCKLSDCRSSFHVSYHPKFHSKRFSLSSIYYWKENSYRIATDSTWFIRCIFFKSEELLPFNYSPVTFYPQSFVIRPSVLCWNSIDWKAQNCLKKLSLVNDWSSKNVCFHYFSPC